MWCICSRNYCHEPRNLYTVRMQCYNWIWKNFLLIMCAWVLEKWRPSCMFCLEVVVWSSEILIGEDSILLNIMSSRRNFLFSLLLYSFSILHLFQRRKVEKRRRKKRDKRNLKQILSFWLSNFLLSVLIR